MPKSVKAASVTPIPGAIYEVLTSKLGPDEDDWHRGKRILAEEFPDVDFERLAAGGAVKRVDPAYQIEHIEEELKQLDADVVTLAQPHREFTGQLPPEQTEQSVIPGVNPGPAV